MVMSLLEKTKFLLRSHRIFPKKSFGQHFMIDNSILEKMVDYALLKNSDVVLDIGAGFGFLTKLLASKCETVLAVESDARLVDVLCEQLKNVSNVKIIKGDVFNVNVPRFTKVVSIPPYNISSSLLLWLFHQKFERAVLIFQKEFANRLVALVGSEAYGWLTVIAYYYVDVELLDDVSRKMFYPPPEVESTIVRLKSKIPPFTIRDEALFKQFVQSLFTQRNRKVRNALVSFIRGRMASDMGNTLKKVESFPFLDKRVRELAPEDFGALLNGLIE